MHRRILLYVVGVAVPEMNATATDGGTRALTGFFKAYQPRCKNISGRVEAPFLAMWDVSKA